MKEWRIFEKVLKENGYKLIRTRGSHCIYSNGNRTLTINRDVNRMVAKRLIKEYELDAEDYLKRYEKFVIELIKEKEKEINEECR